MWKIRRYFGDGQKKDGSVRWRQTHKEFHESEASYDRALKAFVGNMNSWANGWAKGLQPVRILAEKFDGSDWSVVFDQSVNLPGN